MEIKNKELLTEKLTNFERKEFYNILAEEVEELMLKNEGNEEYSGFATIEVLNNKIDVDVDVEVSDIFNEDLEEFEVNISVTIMSIETFDIAELCSKKGLTFEQSRISNSVYITTQDGQIRVSDHQMPVRPTENADGSVNYEMSIDPNAEFLKNIVVKNVFEIYEYINNNF